MSDELIEESAKYVARLNGHAAEWDRFMEEAEDYIGFARPEIEAPLRARIAELEAALKPFADLAEKYDGDVDDQPLWDRDFMPVVADLRAARAAYLGEGQTPVNGALVEIVGFVAFTQVVCFLLLKRSRQHKSITD